MPDTGCFLKGVKTFAASWEGRDSALMPGRKKERADPEYV